MTRLLRSLALLLALVAPTALRAATYPPHPDAFVNDYAGVIDAGSESQLKSDLTDLKRDTGVEMTILTLPSWKANADDGQSLEAYATALFNAWGVGAANRNDGILLLVAPGDRDVRLELGQGYDRGFDLMAEDIVNSWLLPAFRKGDYGAGVRDGTAEIITRIARPHAAGQPAPQPAKTIIDRIFPWVFGAFAAFIVGSSLFSRLAGDWSYRFRRCPQCGQRGMHREHVLPQAQTTPLPTGAPPPTGMIVTRCLHCNYREDRPWSVGTSRPSSGSGGGFGGGRSTGGGASGHW